MVCLDITIPVHNNQTFVFCEHHYKRIANMHSLSLSLFFFYLVHIKKYVLYVKCNYVLKFVLADLLILNGYN